MSPQFQMKMDCRVAIEKTLLDSNFFEQARRTMHHLALNLLGIDPHKHNYPFQDLSSKLNVVASPRSSRISLADFPNCLSSDMKFVP